VPKEEDPDQKISAKAQKIEVDQLTSESKINGSTLKGNQVNLALKTRRQRKVTSKVTKSG